jgi:pimeloyl-ACP methyl ester carboxylesterase
VQDLAVFADHLSPGRPFILAGHDWGASIAYAYAFAHPDRLTHLVVANGVHPVPFQRAILDDPAQRKASQYINLFRQPDAEEWLSDNEFAAMFKMLADFSDTSWMRKAQHSAYIEAWSRPGAMKAMLDWYRASPLVVPESGKAAGPAPILELPAEMLAVAMPHLVVWGEDDRALLASCLTGLETFAPDLTIRKMPGCGHWLLHEQPAAVAAEIRLFLSAR